MGIVSGLVPGRDIRAWDVVTGRTREYATPAKADSAQGRASESVGVDLRLVQRVGGAVFCGTWYPATRV